MSRYLEIARRVIAEQDAAKFGKGEGVLSPESPTFTRDRAYVALFEAAMDRMRGNPMPEACLPWLAERDPALYRMLTEALPDKLEEVWDTPGNHHGAFEWVLGRIVDAHRKARQSYEQRFKNAAQGILESRTDTESKE